MVWVLIDDGSAIERWLRPAKYVVGRGAKAHIQILHPTVSRVHAELHVTAASGNDGANTQIEILDCSSQGQTQVNGKEVVKGERVSLRDGDVVSLGMDGARYQLKWIPVVLSCSSRMSADDMQGLQKQAREAGVSITTEWTKSCTHLLTEQLVVTPKLLCCVVDGAVAVRRSFVEALAQGPLCVKPHPNEHLPFTSDAPGADTEMVPVLQQCMAAPKNRRGLLRDVWVILAKSGLEALTAALAGAGNQMHVVCGSEAQIAELEAEAKRLLQTEPQQVWLVGADPNFACQIISALRAVSGFKPAHCLLVSMKSVIKSILMEDVSVGFKEGTSIAEASVALKTEQRLIEPKVEAPDTCPVANGNDASKFEAITKEDQLKPNGQNQKAQQKAKIEPCVPVSAQLPGKTKLDNAQIEKFGGPTLAGNAGLDPTRPVQKAGTLPAVANPRIADPSPQATLQKMGIDEKTRWTSVGVAAESKQIQTVQHAQAPRKVAKTPLPPGGWIGQVRKKHPTGVKEELVDVDGVQLSRASWETCTAVREKRLASELQETSPRRLNFKAFRKAERHTCRSAEPIPTVPWSEPKPNALGGNLFGDEAQMENGCLFAESQPPAFGL